LPEQSDINHLSAPTLKKGPLKRKDFFGRCVTFRSGRLAYSDSGARMRRNVAGFEEVSREETPHAAQDIYPNAELGRDS
jgi:hypothetical protein